MRGEAICRTICVQLDTTGPDLTVSEPCTTQCNGTSVHVAGSASDANGVARLTVNGVAVGLSCHGSFVTDVALHSGPNTIVVEATDGAGNQSTVTKTVLCPAANTAPVVSAGADQTATLPAGPAPLPSNWQSQAALADASALSPSATGYFVARPSALAAITTNGTVSPFAVAAVSGHWPPPPTARSTPRSAPAECNTSPGACK